MKIVMTLLLILSATAAQSKTLNCNLSNHQDQEILRIPPIAADADIAKRTVVTVNAIDFAVALTGKQVEVFAMADQEFGFSSLSSSSRKKAGMKAALNNLEFKFNCRLEK